MESIYNKLLKQLKKQFNEDPDFQIEIQSLTHFYGRKFITLATHDEQKQYIENQLGDVVKSQYFQGYYIMKSILMDDETTIPEDVWTLNKGIVRNELPVLIDSIFQSNPNEWHRNDIAQSISMKIIQKFDDVFDLVRQMRKDLALYGAYKAFIEDERYQNNQDQQGTHLLLGDPFDLLFLNPQVYMQVQHATTEQEIWDLYMWSSMKNNNAWIGSIHLSTVSQEDDQSLYLLEYTISETITQNEKYDILNTLLSRLPSHVRNVLQTRVYHVRELEVLIPSNE